MVFKVLLLVMFVLVFELLVDGMVTYSSRLIEVGGINLVVSHLDISTAFTRYWIEPET